MSPDVVPRLRIYDSEPDPACRMAARELLRSPFERPNARGLEPFTRGWYEELELKRYARQGEWLPKLLEFRRHVGESLVMVGPGLGTDAIQYRRHETQVTICALPLDDTLAMRRNFELRGLNLPIVETPTAEALPFARGAFDLAYFNSLNARHANLGNVAEEMYRVLKPGGKLLALFPAWYDVGRWQRWLLPLQRLYWQAPPAPTTGPKLTAHELRTTFSRFRDFRIHQRHLRRSELPHVWRLLPTNLLERLLGRVLVLRAFKPLSAVREESSIVAA